MTSGNIFVFSLIALLSLGSPGLALEQKQFKCTDAGCCSVVSTAETAVEAAAVQCHNGCALIVAKKDTVVEARGLKIHLDRGSIAVVKEEPEAVMIRVLSDTHAKSVVVPLSRRSLRLSIGQEATIAKDAVAMRKITHDGIGRRLVASYNDDHFGDVRIAEVNLADNLIDEPVVVYFRRCGTAPKACDQLLKTTAVYSMVSAPTSPYTRAALQ